METRFSNAQVKQVFFLILISFLGILLFRNLYGLFSGFLGAVTIYVLCRRPFFYLTEKRGWNRALCATLLMITSLLVLVVPVALL
jgi:predicted PurR-regulated permease PerM